MSNDCLFCKNGKGANVENHDIEIVICNIRKKVCAIINSEIDDGGELTMLCTGCPDFMDECDA